MKSNRPARSPRSLKGANTPSGAPPGRAGWGGKRRGAGRKASHGRSGVPHVTRPVHKSRFPLHATVRVRGGLPSLRSESLFRCVVEQIRKARRQFLRILHFGVQSNHLHFILEAGDRRCLGRGMKGLGVRLARRINALLASRGSVLAERYHARPLKTPREVRNALVYVLFNRAKHAFARGLDSRSSALYFDGWFEDVAVCVPSARGSPDDWPVARGSTWLITTGWKRLGALRLHERPSNSPTHRRA